MRKAAKAPTMGWMRTARSTTSLKARAPAAATTTTTTTLTTETASPTPSPELPKAVLEKRLLGVETKATGACGG
jgi:hypothetical protein